MRPAVLPSPATIVVLTVGTLLFSAALFAGVPLRMVAKIAIGSLAIGLAFVIYDVWISARAWRAAPLDWRRSLPAALAVGVPRDLVGELVNDSGNAWRVMLFDSVDESLVFEGLPYAVRGRRTRRR